MCSLKLESSPKFSNIKGEENQEFFFIEKPEQLISSRSFLNLTIGA
jgi:hypothetical protein